MRFRAIRLTNWKNIARADVCVPDRLILIGPNASGKSNFLDAFRFLRDLVTTGGGFQEAVQRRGGVSAIRCLAVRHPPGVEIAVSLEEPGGAARWEYRIAFGQDAQGRPILEGESVRRENEVLLERPDSGDRDDPERLRQTSLEQVNANRPFREIATFFASIRYLHLVPQLVREPERSTGRHNDPFGGDFLEQVAGTPERTRNAYLRRIRDALRVAVPLLDAVELWHDPRGVPHLRGRYRNWHAPRTWQTEEQFSDGTLRLIGLLWALQEPGGPLLLEEPELSLHPEIVRHLPQLLARVQRKSGRQIFLSTHSPDLLRDEGIGLDEVLLLLPSPEGTRVEPAGAFDDVRRLLEAGLSMAEAVLPRTGPDSAVRLPLSVE